MDTNYLALLGYSGIFINKSIKLLTKSESTNKQIIMMILLVGLAAFIIYYYKQIQYKKDYKNDKTQLTIRQTAHLMCILFVLGTFILYSKYEVYNLVALASHSLFIYGIFTNTDLLVPSILLAVYFGMISINSFIENKSKMLLLSQLSLFGYFAHESYILIYL